ncbi:HAD family hydrolase [Methanogenium organophilum]|uniref:HAD family hydrolase n=1 Tax=Methanogenium organophilum TaxID=2199 RepID=A0A9X9S365_METOG|nr:HAD family hydrolase [Methanogenium organophilum]WAI00660.1 HAD family hydrolase [Methanogenium organophilum]
MTTAVVFDSAGTLLRTYRVLKDVTDGTVHENVETITLTASCKERALVLLYVHSRDIIDEEPTRLLSEYLREKNINFGISCTCKAVTADYIRNLLYNDTHATIGDLQGCIRTVWETCKKETVVALNSGVMLNGNLGGIEYVITAGGRPFSRARETIQDLQTRGIGTYIASGDRTKKLMRMADYLGVPQDNTHGVATPAIKEQVVEDLKREYDTVVMVGDGINDLRAMKKADFAILSLQQNADKPEPLMKAADFTITSVHQVVDIIDRLQ